ncbi:MAG: phytanoyl-CoA dioxygenase family protein [Flavobacteriales bacterium]
MPKPFLNNRPPIFKDPQLNSDFELNGFVVLPLLSAQEVAALHALYAPAEFENPAGFYSTSFSQNDGLKNKLNAQISACVAPKAAQVFEPFKPLGSCYLSKAPGPSGQMPIHQDWTVVDETTYDSITIWIPLQDVDASNGALQVIPGSHRFSTALRSPFFASAINDLASVISQDLQNVPLKAGEAIIFSQALMHASPPNTSAHNRLAVTYGLIPEAADLYFYYQNPSTQLAEKYLVPPTFFEQYNTQIGQKPNVGTLVETFTYNAVPISTQEYWLQKQLHQLKKHTPMKPIFKNPAHQSFFEKEGYLVLPMLSTEEVQDLSNYYTALGLKDEKGFGFHVSMDQLDKALCEEIRTKIWQTILPKMDQYLENYKAFVASFVVKESNPKGVVPAHQDWSFVDNENEGFCSITCWTALVDTNLDNGCMGVIKGSNRFMDNFRPSPSPQTPVPLSEHMFSIFPYLNTLEMKAGDTLFFDNRTFHASAPNTTSEIRLAAGVGITQKDAQLVHYYLKPDGKQNTVLKYKVDEAFFLTYDNARLSRMYDNGELITDYELLKEMPYAYTSYASQELIELIKAAGNNYNVPMCEKLAVLFNYDMNGAQKEPQTAQERSSHAEQNPPTETSATSRSFFEVYTPANILRELKYKLTGK